MGGVLSFRPERLEPEANIAEEGRELLKPCWLKQTTQNDDSYDDYSEAVQPYFARTATAIQKNSFDLTSAKNMVLDLRQLGQRYEERGCTESCMEGIIVSRALEDVDLLTENTGKTDLEAYDFRQTLVLVYLYCVMAVFPCTVRLERDPSVQGTPPYGWSRKGKFCDVELKKLTRYCFRSGCDKLDALQNFLRNTQLLMDLAACLEMDLNPVAYLIASNTLPFLRKLSEKTNSLQGMTVASERLETLWEMGLVTRASFLLKKDFIDVANDYLEPMMKVNSRRLPPYLAVRIEYVKARLFLHREEYSNAMVTASDALVGLTDVEQKREFEQLIDDAFRSFEAAVRHNEMCGPADQSQAVPTPAQETVQQQNGGPSAKKKKAGKRSKKKRLTKSPPLPSEYKNLRETAPATPRTAAAASEIQVRKENLPVQDSLKPRNTAPGAAETPVKRALTRANRRTAGNETLGAALKAATSTTKSMCHDSDESDAESEAAVMNVYSYDYEEIMSDVTSTEEDLALEDGDQDEQDWFSKSEKAFDNGEPDEEDTDNVWLSEQQKNKFSQGSNEKVFYPGIARYDKAEQLLKSNPDKYKRCQLKIEHAHKSTAKVLEPGCKHSEILIEGRSKAGQTYMDDEVVVEVTAKPRRNLRLQHGSDTEKRAHGRVVGLLNRVNYKDVDHPVLYCTLEDMSGHLMKPLCKTVPKINVLHDLVKKRFPALKKNKVELKKINDKGEVKHTGFLDVQPSKRGQYVFKVVILAWRPKFPYPLGAVLSAHIGGRDYSGGLAVLSMQQKVPKRYPRTAVENTKVLLQETLSKTDRKDLTKLRLFTIDPPGSNDLDDAVSIEKEGTHYVIGVHIADVAAQVPKDCGVDQEARKRAVTFYPLNRRPHAMLPEPLSHEKCSLLQDQERLALSVFFTFNEEGKQVELEEPIIRKTVIRSCRQLTYKEAQKVIDGVDNVNVDPMVQGDIRQLHKITSQLKEMRQKHSMFFVPFEDPRLPELERINDNIEAHSLIEELMILANSTVAKYLTKLPRYRDVMLVRCHKAPTWEELAEWRDTEGSVTNLVMQLQGKSVTPSGTQLSFNGNGIAVGAASQRSRVVVQKGVWKKLCQYLEEGELTEARRLVNMDALHPLQCLAASRWMNLMETAQYRCCLRLNRPELRHFGLDLDVYTHFTSPIRRYADLHVQRLLHAALSGAAPDSTPEDVTALCNVINSATSQQKAFDKGCMSLKVSESLQRQPLLFRAYVDKVDEEQLTVCVPSLLKVSDRKQELPFSMLGVSSQPSVLVDTALRRSTVTVHWNKKIFDVQQTCHGNLTSLWRHLERSPHGPIVMEIRPDRLTYELRHDDWTKILQTVMSSRQEVTEEVPHPLKREKLEVEDMSSEKGDGKVAQRPLKFSRQYTQGHVVQIQMSAHPKKGMLQSRVELLHAARNASVCMLHAMDPVQVLTRPATRETRDQNFTSYKEYVQAWMPLQEMEAAVCAADNRSGVVINNVKVTMKAQESSKGVRFRGSFSLKATFCYERCIEFGGKSTYGIPEEESRNDNPFPLDYLCIRYTMKCSDVIASRVQTSGMADTVDKHFTWLAHAAIVNVVHKGRKSEDGGSVIVTFVLSPSSPQPPPQLVTKHGAELTLEILPKTEGVRRVQEILHELRKPEYDLAHALAHGDTIPELDFEHVQLGMMETNHEVIVSDAWLPWNNQAQLRAIQMALTQSLAIIQGPPGSGKTNTGIKLVYLFSKINRKLKAEGKGKKTVLYCGPSNKSVDHVARELKKKLGSLCPKFVRVYGSAVESKDYPIPRVDSKFTRNQCDPTLRDCALHHLIRKDGKPFAKELAEFKALFDKCHAAPDMYSVTNKQLKTYRTLVFNASVEELKHHEVVLTTCSVAGSQRLVQGTSTDSDCSIFQVIIDECAMSPEPQSMVPIIATKAKQVVLIGDHKQLRPIISCQPAAELGLDQSLFERLFNQFSDYTVFLGTQYRMHPEICAFPSEEFYRDELKTGNSSLWGGDLLPFWPGHPRDPNSPVPHLLINVRGEEKLLSVSTEQGNERSKSNSLEADKAIEILTFLKTQFNVDLQKIKLLTQYNAQRHLLEEKAKEAIQHNRTVFGDQNVDINVSTVVSSQGGEWDYVILTTVSSMPSYLIEPNPTYGWCRQSLGFITDRNQVNVALTRARRGLFIIGNVELLRCDEVWNNLFERYQQLGCVVQDARHFPPPSARRQNRYPLRSTKNIV